MRIDKTKIMVMMAKKGLNQRQLADSLGMSRGNLSTIINGKRCKAETVLKLARALGIEDINDLLEEV